MSEWWRVLMQHCNTATRQRDTILSGNFAAIFLGKQAVVSRKMLTFATVLILNRLNQQ